MLAKGLGSWDVSGVGVGCESFRIAVICQWRPTSVWCRRRDEQATERLGAGSVYFVRFGSGEAGRLGTSCTGCGVDSSAMATIHHGAGRGGMRVNRAVSCHFQHRQIAHHRDLMPEA